MTLGSKHTIQYDVLYNCTLETFIILLTNATPIYSVQKKRQIGYCLLYTSDAADEERLV